KKTAYEMVMGEVKRTFNPEFINRVDEIIIFDALTEEDLVRITRLLVEQLNQNLKEKGIAIALRAESSSAATGWTRYSSSTRSPRRTSSGSRASSWSSSTRTSRRRASRSPSAT